MTTGSISGKTAWIFPGQGSQYRGMGKTFDSSNEQVRLDEASEILGYPVRQLIGSDPDQLLDRTEWTQPALLLVSVLQAERRIRDGASTPSCYLGHSLGEYSALVVAGAFSFGDAIRAVHLRGRYMQEAVPEGSGLMAAVLGMERNALLSALNSLPPPSDPDEFVGMANLNSPGQIVIAGSRGRVLLAVDALKAAGARKVVPLSVSVPSHTPLMESAARKMRPVLEKITWKKPNAPVISNVTASLSSDPSELRECLVRQVTSPVLWEDSVKEALRQGVNVFQELGPGNVLSGLGKRIDKSCVWESLDRGSVEQT
ncbi:MAG: ACP S-malonyltransferase [Leptospirales bacterium]